MRILAGPGLRTFATCGGLGPGICDMLLLKHRQRALVFLFDLRPIHEHRHVAAECQEATQKHGGLLPATSGAMLPMHGPVARLRACGRCQVPCRRPSQSGNTTWASRIIHGEDDVHITSLRALVYVD